VIFDQDPALGVLREIHRQRLQRRPRAAAGQMQKQDEERSARQQEFDQCVGAQLPCQPPQPLPSGIERLHLRPLVYDSPFAFISTSNEQVRNRQPRYFCRVMSIRGRVVRR